tara:strand:+ start:173 stop:403 length:231 start_codon:yes stop_codon:yes gene_type:complete
MIKMKEEEIWKILEDGFGNVFNATDKETRTKYLNRTTEALDIGLKHFKENCSPANYNGMLLALLSYQYWTQKKVIE